MDGSGLIEVGYLKMQRIVIFFNKVKHTKISLGPRLVEARIGAAGAPVATVGTVAFRLYLLIIVRSLTN